MKKVLALVMTIAMLVCLVACGAESTTTGSKNDNGKQDSGKTEAPASADATQEAPVTNGASSVEDSIRNVFRAAYTSATGAYATITVQPELALENDAWIGLCPTGKDYLDEREADDVDIIFFYMDERPEDTDPYVFACDFEPVEDGTYALVVATSDDEAVGYIAIQLTLTKSGDSISVDYTDCKFNEKPAK